MFIPNTFAESVVSVPTHHASIIPQTLLFGVMGLIFYFLLWRPNAKQQQEREELINSLKAGDVIYTNGGIVGKIIQINDEFFKLDVGQDTTLYIQKASVSGLAPTGSLKKLGFK